MFRRRLTGRAATGKDRLRLAVGRINPTVLENPDRKKGISETRPTDCGPIPSRPRYSRYGAQASAWKRNTSSASRSNSSSSRTEKIRFGSIIARPFIVATGTVRIPARGAPRPGRGDRLPVMRILHVAGGKDADNVRAATPRRRFDISFVVEFQRAPENLRIG